MTAPLPVLRDRGGSWELRAVHLNAYEEHNFYRGFANEVIWPLFHDMQSLCNFDPVYWEVYCEVNRKFAHAILESSCPNDFIWAHDYHLMNLAAELRSLGCQSRIGFFLHIPFPAPDLFLKLPWRLKLLQSLLQFDMVGFETMRDRHNFVDCVRALFRDVRLQGKGHVLTAHIGDREVRFGAFPISIDFNQFMRQAASPEVAEKAQELHHLLPGRKLMLGIDRLDFTNPHDLQGVADAIVRAHEMGVPERRARMRRLQRSIRNHDVFWWVDSFLRATFTRDLSYFPLPPREPTPAINQRNALASA